MLTVPSDPVEGFTKFSITVTNPQGAGVTVADSDYPTNIFVDTIGPRIELVGDSDYTVYVGTQNPSIPDAIVTDTDPAYSPNYTVTIDGTLDTDSIGSTVTYTYTAYDDTVGNPGASIDRTVTVIDYDPLNVTGLTIASNNQINTSYARAGDVITIVLSADGSVENATGTIFGDVDFTLATSSSTITLTKTVNQGDTNGISAFDILVTNSSGYAARVTSENLTGENIIIDTILPTLTLNGNNNTISALDSPYTELNATAFDVSYGSKNIAPTVSGTVIVTSIGNYTVTYTAPSDPAGNTGPTITRNVRILDLPTLKILEGFSVTPAGTYADGV